MSFSIHSMKIKPISPALCALLSTLMIGHAAAKAPGEPVDGFLEPYRRIHLASPETGIVTSILVEEGDVVTAGQELAKLDDDIFTAGLAMARHEAESKAQLATAQAQLQMRRSRLEKLSDLFQSGHAQAEEVEHARTDLALAEAAALSVREHLELKKLECRRMEAQLARRTIAAPMDGCVTAIYKREGEVVSPADPKILDLTTLDRLNATFLLSLEQARRLHEQQEVSLRVSQGAEPVPGVVEYVSPVMDAESGTVEVRVRVANSDRKLLSGQRCTFVLP